MNERQKDQDVAERMRRENLERASAPKDNEVDEKVIEAVAWQCRREYSVWEECTKEKHDHIVATGHYGSPTSAKAEARALVPAATVAELRAEVSALSHELDCVNANWQASMAHAKTLRAKADAAERRVGELEAFLRILWEEYEHAAEYMGEGCLGVDPYRRSQFEALTGADPT